MDDDHVDLSQANNWYRVFWEDGLLLILHAVSIVTYSSFRSLDVDFIFKKNSDFKDLSLQGKTAILFPLLGSLSLLFFFYYFHFISIISMMIACIGSLFSLVFTVDPLLNVFTSRSFWFRRFWTMLRFPLAGSIIILWAFTGNTFLSNAMGISLCVVSICFVRVPSLKVASILLICLLVYDIFWVFFSSNIFGENVMVSVATKETVNPTVMIAKTLRLPESFVIPKIQLPMKLMLGKLMLGLGDIVVPGFLTSFALRFDQDRMGGRFHGYFCVSIIGYTIGLFLSMTTAFIYHNAQPALLYLVPSTLLSVFLLGWWRADLYLLWHGPKEGDQEEIEEKEEFETKYS